MTLDKSVAQTFSHAASHYKQHDVVQRITATTLLHNANLVGRLADIGAGPGTDFSQFPSVSDVIAIDIAEGMLAQLRDNFPHYTAVCGDAQQLSLQSSSVDTVYSNLALQWCDNFAQAISEIKRILTPKGECYLSVVADGSLPQLQQLGFGTKSFSSLPQLLKGFDADWDVKARIEPITVYFDDLRSLIYSIKGVGASLPSHHQSQQATPSLRGKQDWQARVALAESLRTEKGIPLTYHIAFIHAKKGCKL